MSNKTVKEKLNNKKGMLEFVFSVLIGTYWLTHPIMLTKSQLVLWRSGLVQAKKGMIEPKEENSKVKITW